MHQSVLNFGFERLTGELVTGKDVIEVGSLNVNGSLRDHCEMLKPSTYIGIDLTQGPGVDVIFDFCSVKLHRVPERVKNFGMCDLLVCTEMLEHAWDWRTAIRNMKALIRPGGTMLLTTRSQGFARHHEHPGDFWRFSCDDMALIFSDFRIVVLISDPGGSGGGPGVFLLATKPEKFLELDLDNIDVYSMEAE